MRVKGACRVRSLVRVDVLFPLHFRSTGTAQNELWAYGRGNIDCRTGIFHGQSSQYVFCRLFFARIVTIALLAGSLHKMVSREGESPDSARLKQVQKIPTYMVAGYVFVLFFLKSE